MGANFIKKAGVYPDKGGKLNPLDDITRRSLKRAGKLKKEIKKAMPFSTLHRKSARAKALEKMPKQKKRKEYTSRLSAKGGNFPGGYMGGKGFLLPAGPGGKRRRVTEAEFKKMSRKMKPLLKRVPKKKKK